MYLEEYETCRKTEQRAQAKASLILEYFCKTN